jgi:predicted esterase
VQTNCSRPREQKGSNIILSYSERQQLTVFFDIPKALTMTAPNIPTVTVGPKEAHTHTVVFLHGRGDNARQFAASLAASRDSGGRALADAFPSFRWVFPQAPERELASSPGTIWPQWFDVWNVRDFAEEEELQAVGLREVIPGIQRILADEATLLKGHWDRIVLMG